MRLFSRVKKYSKPEFWWHLFLMIGLVGLVFSWGDVSRVGNEVSKVEWFGWLARILTVIYGWQLVVAKKKLRKLDRFICMVVVGFSHIAIVVSIFAGGVGHSLLGNYFRNDGLISWFQLVVFGYLVTQMWDPRWKTYLAGAVAFLGCLTVFAPWLGKLMGLPLGHGNASLDAGLILMSAPFSLYLIYTHRGWWGVALLVQLFGLVYTGAWGALASLLLGSLALAGLMVRKGWQRMALGLLMVLMVIYGSLAFFWYEYHPSLGDSSYHTESRVRIVVKLIKAIAQQPWGWGWANVDPAFRSVDWPLPTTQDVYLDKAHSEWLEIAVTTGLVGLLCYLLFQGRVLWLAYQKAQHRGDKAWSYTLFLALLIFVFHSQTNIVSISEQVIFWLLVGLVARIDNPTRSSYALNAPSKKYRSTHV